MTTVTVYSKPNCQQCRATERWLDARGIAFEHADATEPGNLDAIRYLGYQQAPVVIVNSDGKEDHWSGFNPIELDKHLGTWRAAS